MEDAFIKFCGLANKNDSHKPSEVSFIEEICFTESVNFLVHLGFVICSLVGLTVIKCRWRSITTFNIDSGLRGWIHFPWHYIRWILTFFYIFISACCLADGILSQFYSMFDRPFIYIPDVAQLASCVLSIIYYDVAESANAPMFLVLFIFHWPAALSINVFKTYQLYTQKFTTSDLTFLLVCTLVTIYGSFLILELGIFFKKGYFCPGYSRDIPPLELQDPEKKFHQSYVNVLSQITYTWISWVLKSGYREPIKMEDLGKLPQEETAQKNFDLLKMYYDQQKAKTPSGRAGSQDLAKVYVKAFGGPFLIASGLKIIGDLAGFGGPLCIDGILRFVSAESKKSEKGIHFVSFWEFISNGYVLAFLMLCTVLLQNVCLQISYYIVIRDGIHIKTALQTMIYLKALSLPTWVLSGGHLTVGQIINHMSVDAFQIMMAAFMGYYVIAIPAQIILAVLLLYMQLGYSALIGASIVIMLIPLQYFISKRFTSIQRKTMECSDDRIKKSNEMLQSIKLLKLYSWEGIFVKAVEMAREKELKYLLKGVVYVIATLFFTQVTPIFATMVTFSIYSSVSGSPLTANKAFTALALFDKFNAPLHLLPVIIKITVNAVVSTCRLSSFFNTEELKRTTASPIGSTEAEYCLTPPDTSDRNGYMPVELVQTEGKDVTDHSNNCNDLQDHPDKPHLDSLINDCNGAKPDESIVDDVDLLPSCSNGNVLEIHNGCFTWDRNSDKFVLQDISMKISRSKVTVIIGKVGSGKTSLISAILGEMTTVSGHVVWASANQPLAYCAQTAWLRNASLQDNIVFEERFDEERFQTVVEACALQPDIDILPAGRLTEIGEKGINLSGGQKQRVSLARALYSRCSVVILDDPLSALDAHVGSHVFHQGIMGILKREHRTTIFVTHKLEYVEQADYIIVMQDGKIEVQGTYKDLSEQNPDIVKAWKSLTAKSDHEEDKETEVEMEDEVSKMEKKPNDNSRGKLIQEEEREEGSIPLQIYLSYARAIGLFFSFFLIFCVITKQSFLVAVDFWLAEWSSAGNHSETTGTQYGNNVGSAILNHFLYGYIGLTFSGILCALLSSLAHVISGIRASKYLFIKMLQNVAALPLRFFETTPVGRILNRFSSDFKTIDDQIPSNLERLMWHIALCLSAIVINSVVAPFFLLPVIPLLVLYYFLQMYFRASSRELQRLDSITKSPVFAHFSETLGGLTTIRAYRHEDSFFQQILNKIDYNTTAYLYLNTVNRWLGIRLDFIGTSIVFASAFCSLLTATLGYLQAGLVGLAILYALKMSTYLNWCIREFAEMEMQMNAVERVNHYTTLPSEQQLKESQIGTGSNPTNWPQSGAIEFNEVSVRYDEKLDPVIYKLTLKINPGTKVGICGRTGSGKSSLALALLRIVDNFEGCIKVDGLDISSVTLDHLRQSISIIPQDPILFNGTIRFNLDPDLVHSDEELWEALEVAQLKSMVSELPEGLNTLMTEGSENFSLGQRQLFCIARALIKKSKITIMDEATASVDMETDAAFQTVIHTAFTNSTVLIIAHRIRTIMDCKRVLVMEQGRIVEDGDPQTLQHNDGLFAKLVKAAK
ncbi:ATP-binding cassette sub-family C member 9-like isoform X1 [Chiloscyllium plagiosum]|uniref:ATP-binding cassette sub-family C member 9-like isoform X1 n=2 Tax=Chiloscyllium plagiosum TaxID=36176 RepID=UPI001CB7CDCF|nr:ATP-binding cassette sub-family C member 9-like isoform X1 [Chiloscyllium plagiosum]XP_043545108.1 ATP-binding cassette sub-family C member 9-like isoform X1 [Chiloscyllium plagiosum]XP_043545109.1 ATP-binding cassette sub-family C member 9-like isoform X1 [Chiloscyllium plagiosum]XP_043545110.1 ATP-binding cassette sub-family C member 9-like isoform X1 [Chiloscyllium plagiosum]XP_043545111.1 ATP-binding cassette sub-family C member 9-like isoform X1 [Chiloscyllium plagiosum]XP_043545113.1 